LRTVISSTTIKHTEAIRHLGLSRILPKLEAIESKKYLAEIKFNEFLSDYSEDEE
jgi:hypothetical protein